MSRIAVGLLVSVLAVTTCPGVVGSDRSSPGADIVAIYPNPVADGDRGEYVTLSVPPETNLTGWTLSDDHDTVDLPNVTASGRVTLSTAPDQVRTVSNGPVYELDGHLALANSGENVTLRDGTRPVARISYADAPEGEIGQVANGRVTWESLGRTDFEVHRGGGGQVETFVLPDAADKPVSVLHQADNRILLAGYTFGSRRVASALVAASERGVDVQVLLEGAPVGGMTDRQAQLLDRLVDHNVSVAMIDGPYARVDHHHAKYAVVDDRAIVLTENWKPAGTGGQSSRGWGVVLEQSGIVETLAATFRADAGWHDAVAWTQFRAGRSFDDGTPAEGTFRQQYRPRVHEVSQTALMVAPDNAESGVIARLDAAEDSIAVVQVGVGGPDQSFVRALKRAASRGVDVRLLLSSAWYTREENQAVATRLEAWANRDGASLSVRLARPRGRFEKIHAKGVVIDGETVLLGSLNWNDHAARENREVVVALTGAGPAAYFQRVFRADWQAAVWRLTWGLVGLTAAIVIVASGIGRRIEFDPPEALDQNTPTQQGSE